MTIIKPDALVMGIKVYGLVNHPFTIRRDSVLVDRWTVQHSTGRHLTRDLTLEFHGIDELIVWKERTQFNLDDARKILRLYLENQK